MDLDWRKEERWTAILGLGSEREPFEVPWDEDTPTFEFSPARERLVDGTADAVAGIMD